MITSILSVQASSKAEKKKTPVAFALRLSGYRRDMIQFSFFNVHQQLCINPFMVYTNAVNEIVPWLGEGLTYLSPVPYCN